MDENTGSGQGPAATFLGAAAPRTVWSEATDAAALMHSRRRLLLALCAAVSLAVMVLLAASAAPAVLPSIAMVTLALGLAVFSARQGGLAVDRLLQLAARGDQLEARLHRAEHEAAAACQRAEAAERCKSAFFSAAGHELRTPLTGIIGVMDLLREEVPRSGRAPYLLDVAAASGDALLTLVNDVLDLAKTEAGRFEIVPADADLHDTLLRCLEPLRLRANEQGLVLHVDWQAGLPRDWFIDARRVRQAVTNLVGNAIKFTETGSVSVAVSGRALSEMAGEWTLVIAVIDGGTATADVPMPDADASAPSSIVGRHAGTGIGLHVSRELARRMGGSLEVAGLPGRGARFTLTLPARLAAPPGDDASAPAAALTPHEAVLRILVADDNATNRLVLCEHLQRWGHEVHIAEDGREALDACGVHRFDLVLLDRRMPRLDGLQAIERLRGRTLDDALPLDREVFVAAISANTESEDRLAFERAGAQAFLDKPVSLPQLHGVVARALAHQRRRGIPLAPNTRATAAMDQEAIERWLSHEGSAAAGESAPDGEAARSARLQATFARELPGHAARLEQARGVADLAAIAEIAHSLAGAGLYVGLPVLTQLAQQTERQCREGPRQAALASAAGLQRCLGELSGAGGPQEPLS